MVLATRLKKARLAKRLSQTALARCAGCDQQLISKIEKGESKSTSYIGALADCLGVSTEWLMGRSEEPSPTKYLVDTVHVRGIVAAGIWQSDVSQIEDKTPVPRSPNAWYANKKQSAYKIVGNSMNLVARDGEYAICVDYDSYPVPLRRGDRVVVQRHRGGEYERSLKEYHEGENGPELWPRSSDPQYQEPIPIQSEDEATTVEILGFVVGYFRPD